MIFKKAVVLVESKAHLTPEGLKEIKQIKSKLVVNG